MDITQAGSPGNSEGHSTPVVGWGFHYSPLTGPPFQSLLFLVNVFSYSIALALL